MIVFVNEEAIVKMNHIKVLYFEKTYPLALYFHFFFSLIKVS